MSTLASFRALIALSFLHPLTHVIQLSTACVHSLQQLIHLVIAHLLAQVCEDVSELANANEACEVLVEDLETAAVLFRLAWVAEAARAVEDAGEGVEVNCFRIQCQPNRAQIGDLHGGGVCSYSLRQLSSRGP